MAAKAELELREILLTTGLVQPVKVSSLGGGHVGAVCRLMKGQDKAWLKAVEYLLRLGEENDVPFHLGTRFVLKDGQMAKGWDVAIEAKSGTDLKRCLDLFKTAAQAIAEMEPPEEERPVVPTHTTAPPPAPAPEEEPQAPLDPAELEKRAAAYAKRTNAPPRAASEGGDVPPPPSVDTRPKVVFRGRAKDQKNRMVPVIIEEVTLPHYYPDDMNVPNEKGRGATTTA
jgi:hypothetical protein